jgi:peptidyl-prolyl cis-trans isomerase SurA
MEIAQIVRKPPVSDAERKAVRARLEEYRTKILEGSDFAVYAALYSEDKSSAKKGGELGLFERGMMVPEFEAAAFNLKTGEISSVIETKFGFHILKLIERRGEQINVRHILLQPKVNEDDIIRTAEFLDSLSRKINQGAISFEAAALKYSDDADTKNNGGLLINTETGSSRLSPDKLDRLLFFQVDTMPLNRVSKPLAFTTVENAQAYRLVMVRSKTSPHKANLTEDYQRIQEAAMSQKQNKALSEWIEKRRKNTYVQINDDLGQCEELKDWTLKQQ